MPWWVQLIIMIVSYYVQSQAQAKAAAKAKQQQEEQQRQADLLAAQARGILLNVEANDSPLPVIYGRRRVGGVVCLKETSGARNDFLHKIVAFGEGPIQAIFTVYLDGVPATDPRFSFTTSSGYILGSGITTLTTNSVLLEGHLGAADQVASPTLLAELPEKWTSAHRGLGVPYVYGRFQWNENSWQGEPVVTADVHGRPCYDPRDGVTRFTNNPLLVVREYLTNEVYGRGIPSSAIDDAQFIVEANFADERVAVPAHSEQVSVLPDTDVLVFAAPTIFGLGDGVAFEGSAPPGCIGGSPTHKYYYIPITKDTGKLAASYADALAYTGFESPTVCVNITGGAGSPDFTLTHVDQVRYQLDGVVDTDQTPLDNVIVMLTACRGDLIYAGGKYKVRCDKAEAATGFTFTEDNIIGGWRIELPSRREKLNRVTARFFNPSREWQPDFQIFDSPTYRTEDNELVLEMEINLPYTANAYRAQREAQLTTRQSRLGIGVKFRATIDAFRNEVGDIVYVTHSTPGWVEKQFRVIALEMRPDDEVDVVLREYDVGVYSLDPLSEVRTAPVTNLPNPFASLDINDLVATSGTADLLVQGDGTIVPRIRLRWTEPANIFISYYEIQHSLTASPTEWRDSPDAAAPASEGFVFPVNDGDVVDVRIRAVTSIGNKGQWEYSNNHTVIGKTEPPSDVEGATAYQNAGVIVFGCDTVPDVDLDLIEVRWLDFDDESWDNGIPVANILRGQNLPSASIPQGQWTFLFKAKDTSGNYSTNAARADLIVTADGFSLISTREDSPNWVGTLDGFLVSVSNVLVPESSLPASSHTNAELFEQYVPHPVAISTYTAPEIDKGIDGTTRIYADIVSTLGRGVSSGMASPEHHVDLRTDAGSYDGYEPWTIGSASFRYARSRIYSDNSVGRIRITGFETTIDSLTRTETGTYTTPAGGSVAVTFSTPFHLTPGVVVSPVGSGNIAASADGITTTGFTGYHKTAGAVSAGTANYTATGA